MDPNFKSVHTHAYMNPRSVEQHLHKEIVRLVDIGILEEGYSSEWGYIFTIYEIPKKMEL
jgi:hypothetical protein